mgnify:CR=1 FL=1
MAEVRLRTSGTASQTSVESSGTSVSLIAANKQRKSILIQNTSTAILYVLFGTGTATATTAHSLQMAANTSYLVEGYTGALTGIWASANGQANLTEFL